MVGMNRIRPFLTIDRNRAHSSFSRTNIKDECDSSLHYHHPPILIRYFSIGQNVVHLVDVVGVEF